MAIVASEAIIPRERETVTWRYAAREALPHNLLLCVSTCAALLTPSMAWATDYTSTFSCTGGASCALLPSDTVTTSSGRGVSATAAGQVSINGTPITTLGNTSEGFYASGIGSVIDANNATVTTSGTSSYGALAASGALISLSGSSIITSGDDARGLWAQAGLNDTSSTITLTNTAIHTSGTNAYGAVLQSVGQMLFNGGNTITTTGANAHAIRVQTSGNKTFNGAPGNVLPTIVVSGDGAAALNANGSTITVAGTTALDMSMTTGTNTWGAKLEGTGGNITFTGNSSTGGTGLWSTGSSSRIALSGNADSTGSRVRLYDNAYIDLTGHVGGVNLGSLESNVAGTQVLLGANSLTLGANNAGNNGSLVDNANFNGHFNGTGGLIKTGTLNQILSGAGNAVSSVLVTGGTLTFEQAGTFTVGGNHTTTAGATTSIGQQNSTLTVNGVFTQAVGSTLDATLGASPDIVAGSASLDGNLVIRGFAIGPTPTRASDIVGNLYTLIHTTGAAGITGNFANNPLGTSVDYLVQDGHISPDGRDYVLGFGLAWTVGGQPSGTGTFTLADGTGFDVDVALADQPVPSGGFASGWNGRDLVKAGDGLLILSAANTYTGSTTIDGGVLRTGLANVFASSSDVSVNSGATLDMNGYDQIANRFTGMGLVTLGTATLTANNATLADNTTFAGSISGSGGLTKTGQGTLTLATGNSYTGGTALKQGRIDIGDNSALGTGELAMDDGTTLGFITDGLTVANPLLLTGGNDPVIDTGTTTQTISGAITGTGDLTKQGSGTLILTGANTYTGDTHVETGTLRAGAANTFSAGSAHSVSSGATIDLSGFNQTIAALTNSGTVSLTGTLPGTTLTVNGPYTGNGGILKLGTALGGSDSISDRLILNGINATASGTTSVQITNISGLGGLTTGDGIELVTALNGATTTAQTSRDAFVLAGGQIDVGAFEYRLYAADANGTGENWYLRSTAPPPPEPEPPLPEPEPEATYRPEVPLYAALPAQQRQADLTMLENLHRRMGDETNDPANGDSRRVWGRAISSDIDIHQPGTVDPASSQRLRGLQAGTDLWADSRWHTGAYLGHLEGDANVNGFARGISNLHVGKNDLRSQYLGLYATYTGDTGFYADVVAQAARHRYTVEPMINESVSGDGDSWLFSVEVGQAFPLSEHWLLEPQLQVAHQSLNLDDVDIFGARIEQDIEAGWLGRIGIRLKGTMATGVGIVQPYARLNMYLAPDRRDVARFIGPAATTDIVTRTGHTTTELAAGANLQLSPAASLYGELGTLSSSGGAEKLDGGLQGSLGARFRW